MYKITGSQLFLADEWGLNWARIFRKSTFEERMIIKVLYVLVALIPRS
jgi:hypothetical protein